MTKVLRMGRGDQFILMDAKGTRFLAEITGIADHEVRVRLLRSLPTPEPSPIETILGQALLKSRAMDYVVQKTSELGLDRLFPFCSERTVVRLEEDRSAEKLRHWRKIALNAAKQADRRDLMEVGNPFFSLRQATEHWQNEMALKVILWEQEDSKDLKGLLAANPGTKRFIGLVGPEGGFAPEEIDLARRAGFIPVSMGKRILRAETAAMILIAIVQYEWGDLSLRQPSSS